jgi:hypothetical protein|tara:strand:- start:200 stop:694 length:495 start_codon:yes stop_codon:yes gene_type:complete
MNRFIIEFNVEDIAKSLCDQHIVKMPLEEAQMLCTTLWHHAPEYAEEKGLYKPVHQKHPCTLWAMQTRDNYAFAFSLYDAMLTEYTHRYGKWHGAMKHIDALDYGRKMIPEGWQTPHPQCFSGLDHLKTDEQYPIKAYREFYKADKLKFARYNRGRYMPEWMAA